MIFELTGVSKDSFQHIDDFFSKNTAPGLLEKVQELSLPHVTIQSREWLFDGIRMGYSDWQFKQPGTLGWKYEIKDDLVTFQANLRGSVFMNGLPEPIFKSRQHNLFYTPGQETSEGFLASDGLQASMLFLQFTRDAFLRLTEGASESLNRFNEGIISGRQSVLSPQNLPLKPGMTNLIHGILNCPYTGGLKRMFLLSKSIEFLVLQSELCNVTTQPSYRYIKTRRDDESIAYACDYVTDNLLTPPSLSELARIVGINEYKLKRGFKETYGTTVFGYIAEAKLERARNEILRGEKSISEIALELGYSSLQHFSAAFKKKYRINPSALR
jgi:AraC-like DNA-binding protein